MAPSRRSGVQKRELSIRSKQHEPLSKRSVIVVDLEDGIENNSQIGKQKIGTIKNFFGCFPENASRSEESKHNANNTRTSNISKGEKYNKKKKPEISKSPKKPALFLNGTVKTQSLSKKEIRKNVQSTKGSKEKELQVIKKTRPQILLDHIDYAPFWNVGTSTIAFALLETMPEWAEFSMLHVKPVTSEFFSQKWTELTESDSDGMERFMVEIKPLDESMKSSGVDLSWNSQLWSDVLHPSKIDYWSSECNRHITVLKHLLKRWKKRLDKDAEEEKLNTSNVDKKSKKIRRSVRCKTESEEFSDDADYAPDIHNADEMENPIVLFGRTGAGIENLVCSLSRGSGFDVLEMHSGEKRDADTLRRKLQGATSTHRVTTNSVSSFFGSGGTQKIEEIRKHTLILVSSIDVVFEADRDFAITLSNFLSNARVPVILTCENKINSGPLMNLPRIAQYEVPLPDRAQFILEKASRELGRMQISSSDSRSICDFFGNDIRKSLQWLQLACAKEGTYCLPANLSSRSMNPYENHTVGSEWEHTPSAVFVDHLQIENDLRIRNEELLSHIQPTISPPPTSLLPHITHSLQYFDSVKGLCTDMVPMLDFIDKAQRRVIQNNRRVQHYFDRVEKESSIDGDGQLRKWLHLFNENAKRFALKNSLKFE